MMGQTGHQDGLRHMHLVVLQHGMWGRPEDMQFVSQVVQQMMDARRVLVLNSDVNAARLTYDGIDVLGDRLAKLIVRYCERLASGGIRRVAKISFVAYSLGGLIARYAIGKLAAIGFLVPSPTLSQRQPSSRSTTQRGTHPVPSLTTLDTHIDSAVPVGRHTHLHDDHPTQPGTSQLSLLAASSTQWQQRWRSLKPPLGSNQRQSGQAAGGVSDPAWGVIPVNFVSFASPHLGAWAPPTSLYRAAFNTVLPYTLSRTGSQLVMSDCFLEGRPLLQVLADPECAFHVGLAMFQKRIILANTRHDATVPFTTSSITHHNPYEHDAGLPINTRYPCVVRPAAANNPPGAAHISTAVTTGRSPSRQHTQRSESRHNHVMASRASQPSEPGAGSTGRCTAQHSATSPQASGASAGDDNQQPRASRDPLAEVTSDAVTVVHELGPDAGQPGQPAAAGGSGDGDGLVGAGGAVQGIASDACVSEAAVLSPSSSQKRGGVLVARTARPARHHHQQQQHQQQQQATHRVSYVGGWQSWWQSVLPSRPSPRQQSLFALPPPSPTPTPQPTLTSSWWLQVLATLTSPHPHQHTRKRRALLSRIAASSSLLALPWQRDPDPPNDVTSTSSSSSLISITARANLRARQLLLPAAGHVSSSSGGTGGGGGGSQRRWGGLLSHAGGSPRRHSSTETAHPHHHHHHHQSAGALPALPAPHSSTLSRHSWAPSHSQQLYRQLSAPAAGRGPGGAGSSGVAHPTARPIMLPRSARLQGDVFVFLLPLLVLLWLCMLLWLVVLSAHHYTLLLVVRRDRSWDVRWPQISNSNKNSNNKDNNNKDNDNDISASAAGEAQSEDVQLAGSSDQGQPSTTITSNTSSAGKAAADEQLPQQSASEAVQQCDQVRVTGQAGEPQSNQPCDEADESIRPADAAESAIHQAAPPSPSSIISQAQPVSVQPTQCHALHNVQPDIPARDVDVQLMPAPQAELLPHAHEQSRDAHVAAVEHHVMSSLPMSISMTLALPGVSDDSTAGGGGGGGGIHLFVDASAGAAQQQQQQPVVMMICSDCRVQCVRSSNSLTSRVSHVAGSVMSRASGAATSQGTTSSSISSSSSTPTITTAIGEQVCGAVIPGGPTADHDASVSHDHAVLRTGGDDSDQCEGLGHMQRAASSDDDVAEAVEAAVAAAAGGEEAGGAGGGAAGEGGGAPERSGGIGGGKRSGGAGAGGGTVGGAVAAAVQQVVQRLGAEGWRLLEELWEELLSSWGLLDLGSPAEEPGSPATASDSWLASCCKAVGRRLVRRASQLCMPLLRAHCWLSQSFRATAAAETDAAAVGDKEGSAGSRQVYPQEALLSVMCDNLNELRWHRVDVDTQHYHAHAAIVVRSATRFAASHGHIVEYAVRQMRDIA